MITDRHLIYFACRKIKANIERKCLFQTTSFHIIMINIIIALFIRYSNCYWHDLCIDAT